MFPAPRRLPAELPVRVKAFVVFGGRSAEHDVSRVSAANITAALDPDRYEIVTVGIGRDGTWRLTDAADRADGADPGLGGLSVAGAEFDPLPAWTAAQADGELPAVVIPVLHGPNGEDGTIQGLLELAGIAYVGTGVLGSAASMDKAMAKTILGAAGIPQARYHVARAWEVSGPLLDDVAADLGFPIFVKPANMGSSVGVSRAVDRRGLEHAVEVALLHDELVIFEEAILGRELEIGVLGNEFPKVSVPGEIIPASEFYDYDDKYRDGAARTIVPAELDDAAVAEMSRLAIAAFGTLRAEGLARVDMFYDRGGRGFVVNEINTFPGFTPISMFPMMWAASGRSYGDLLDEMVRLAFDRHARRQRS